VRRAEKLWQLVSGGCLSEVLAFPVAGYHSAHVAGADPKLFAGDARVMAEVQLKVLGGYGSDFLSPPMDLTVEAEALGARVAWGSIPPSVKEHLPLGEAGRLRDLEGAFLSSGRVPAFLECVRILRELGGGRAVCGFAAGPLTLAASLFGAVSVLRLTRANPRLLAELVDSAGRLVELYSSALGEAGADCVMILEPVAALVSPQHFEAFLLEPLRSALAAVEKRGGIPALHVCGDANRILKLMATTGARILSIDAQVDVGRALAEVDGVVMGNVPTSLFLSSPEEVRRYTLAMLSASRGRRHIAASGCDIPVRANPESVKAMVETAKSFRVEC
jgi:uroporphyrinogen decarboxylase